MLNMTADQQKAYARFIKARDAVKLVRTSKNISYEWIPHRDYLDSIKNEGEPHPLFIQNMIWDEYKQASMAWWQIEPEFRKDERMRMSRGDYGVQDNWEESPSGIRDVLSEIKGE